jgi:hypothetical protein
MSKKQPPAVLPPKAKEVPAGESEIVNGKTVEGPVIIVEESKIASVVLEVEEEKYQTEQETVCIVETPPMCPRCGSTERTRLVEFYRTENADGHVIFYRTQCRGRIVSVDKDGKIVVDSDGNPVSYECGNRYKVKKLVPKMRKSAS